MPLSPGARLGAYEILTLIGSGGMGEVYRAHDPRLGRDVAIKIVLPALSGDREHLRRFEQEARAAAALNDPNILTIHEVGQTDGVPYLVTELLDGRTLREVLQCGPPSVRQAIDLATQIANGLAAAHAHGIVHRDLKPENVFITKDGRAKILDFGLAKLAEGAGDSAMLTRMPAVTVPGVVLGTVAYMSPEQLRGEVVDYRTDIFAFGAIVYEMLSGAHAFAGRTPAETISAILTADPVRLSTHSTSLPESLDRTVRHCLEKQRADRFQSAKDIAFALANVVDAPSVRRALPSPRERYVWMSLVLALIATVGMLLYQQRVQPRRTNVTLVTTGLVSELVASALRAVLVNAEPTWSVDVRSTTAGSVEAAQQLERGNANLGFMNSLVAFHTVKTDRVLGHRSEAIAGVAVLWGIAAQVFVELHSPVQHMEDLRGKKVSAGVDDSGDRFGVDLLLDHFGIGANDITRVSMDAERAVNAVLDGSVDAGMLWQGIPAPDIRRGFDSGRMRLVSLDAEALQSLHVKNPFLTPFVIPPRIYPRQPAAVTTVQTKMLLVASRSMSTDVVERILRSLADHRRDLIAAHPTASQVVFTKVPTVEDGMSIDLHPGAERFYRSQPKS